MPDKYHSFLELSRNTPSDGWRVVTREVPDSEVLIIAPHGGAIEIGTSELASAVAGEQHSLYCFEGLRQFTFHELHVTSHRFDDPLALRLAARSAIVVGIHGCKGQRAIFVGGRDRVLADRLTGSLRAAGFPAQADGHAFPALHPDNICNRSARGVGAQLELTLDLRTPQHCEQLAAAVQEALRAHTEALLRPGRLLRGSAHAGA